MAPARAPRREMKRPRPRGRSIPAHIGGAGWGAGRGCRLRAPAAATPSKSNEQRGRWSLCRCTTSFAPWTSPPSRVCCGSARGSTSRVSEGPRPLSPAAPGSRGVVGQGRCPGDGNPGNPATLPLPKPRCDLGPHSTSLGLGFCFRGMGER